MSTTTSTRPRRQHVTPSLVKSETFLFALLVLGLAFYVPYVFRTGDGAGVKFANSTNPAFSTGDSFAQSRAQGPIIGPSPTPVVSGPQPSLTAPGEQRPAPITYIAPYLLAFGRGLLKLVVKLPGLIYRLLHTTVWRPLSYPLALILAVLRPITLLLEVIYGVFLRIPLAILAWFVREAIYPLYVFTGIAAIIGVTFGYSASHVPRAAIFVAEQIRSRISQQAQPALITGVSTPTSNRATAGATPSYSNNGGSFRKLPPGISRSVRSVTFDDVNDEDGTESDVTEVESRSGLGLRGISSSAGY